MDSVDPTEVPQEQRRDFLRKVTLTTAGAAAAGIALNTGSAHAAGTQAKKKVELDIADIRALAAGDEAHIKGAVAAQCLQLAKSFGGEHAQFGLHFGLDW